jgi:hypothetical protein
VLLLHLLGVLLLSVSLHLVVLLGLLGRRLGAVSAGRLAEWRTNRSLAKLVTLGW